MTTLTRVRLGDVARLRGALLCGDQRLVDLAAAPLIDRLYENLLRFCDRLLAGARHPPGIDGVDLAQEAWVRALQWLADPDREAIPDDPHFERLLYRIARTRFLDLLDWRDRRPLVVELDALAPGAGVEPGMTVGERIPGRAQTERDLLFEGDQRLLPLLEAVFAGDEALRSYCRRPVRRRACQYQALVLYHLGQYYHAELAYQGQEERLLLRRFVHLLGVPSECWNAVEQVVVTDEESLLATVNARCGTRVRDRATLSVLRYELRRLVD